MKITNVSDFWKFYFRDGRFARHLQGLLPCLLSPRSPAAPVPNLRARSSAGGWVQHEEALEAAVGQMELRLREAGRLGFKTFLMPESSTRQLKGKSKEGVRIVPVRTVAELADGLFQP